jgi:hypothetical protein
MPLVVTEDKLVSDNLEFLSFLFPFMCGKIIVLQEYVLRTIQHIW